MIWYFFKSKYHFWDDMTIFKIKISFWDDMIFFKNYNVNFLDDTMIISEICYQWSRWYDKAQLSRYEISWYLSAHSAQKDLLYRVVHKKMIVPCMKWMHTLLTGSSENKTNLAQLELELGLSLATISLTRLILVFNRNLLNKEDTYP